jgi:hypothetical protein
MYCCRLTYRSLYHIITTEKEIIYCEVYMIVDEMVRMKLEKIPVVLRNEVVDYLDFLLQKHTKAIPKTTFTFAWEGGLKEFNGTFSSVDLQHKAMEWR